MLAFLAENRAALPLSSEHFNMLRDIVKALRIEARTPVPRGRQLISSPLEGALRETTGMSLTSIISTVWLGMVIRMTSPRHALTRIGVSAFGAQATKEATALWREAIFDKDAAANLMQLIVQKGTGASAREGYNRARALLLGVGVNYIADTEE